MRTCSYVRSIEIPLWVEGCVHPDGMASAAPSRDLELVKPAGLHFVEETPRVTNLFYPGITVKYTSLPVQYTSFPVHYPTVYSYEAYESVVGHVSRICQRVSSRTASHRVLDRIRIKMKW